MLKRIDIVSYGCYEKRELCEGYLLPYKDCYNYAMYIERSGEHSYVWLYRVEPTRIDSVFTVVKGKGVVIGRNPRRGDIVVEELYEDLMKATAMDILTYKLIDAVEEYCEFELDLIPIEEKK
jgi:hypothetical protein